MDKSKQLISSDKSKQLNVSEEKSSKTNHRKKIKVFLIVTAIVSVLGVSLFFIYNKFFKDSLGFSPLISKFNQKDDISLNIVEEKEVCPLDGKLVDKDKARRTPLAVSIENHIDARPQSGLDKADFIYEALTEGHITRFLVFYGCGDAQEIGPVRSARTYFIDWLSEFDAFFAHCGGSIDALDQIISYEILGLNQFYNAKAYWRSDNRYAPHNLYSSTDGLWDIAKEKGWDLESDLEGFKFKTDISSDQRPENQEIKVDYQDYYFKVRWVYNQEDNNYLRFQGGTEHKDRVTGSQLTGKNIIIQFIPSTYPVITRIGEYNRKINTIGSGKIIVFLDGKAQTGTWKKTSRTSRTKYFNDDGEEIELNPGLTWIEIVDPGTEIIY